MSQEEFHKPTEEEIEELGKNIDEQMGEYYISKEEMRRAYKPTDAHVEEVLKKVASQSGEEYKSCDAPVSEREIIEKNNAEGWLLLCKVTNQANTDIYEEEGYEIKKVPMNEQVLIFKRKKEGYEYEDKEDDGKEEV